MEEEEAGVPITRTNMVAGVEEEEAEEEDANPPSAMTIEEDPNEGVFNNHQQHHRKTLMLPLMTCPICSIPWMDNPIPPITTWNNAHGIILLY